VVFGGDRVGAPQSCVDGLPGDAGGDRSAGDARSVHALVGEQGMAVHIACAESTTRNTLAACLSRVRRRVACTVLRVIDANPSLREPDPVAAGALDGHDQPRSGGVVEDPGQHLGIAGGVVC
jgi:hypothetical protein